MVTNELNETLASDGNRKGTTGTGNVVGSGNNNNNSMTMGSGGDGSNKINILNVIKTEDTLEELLMQEHVERRPHHADEQGGDEDPLMIQHVEYLDE